MEKPVWHWRAFQHDVGCATVHPDIEINATACDFGDDHILAE